MPACLPTYLPACLSVCLSVCLPAYLPACLPACLPAFHPLKVTTSVVGCFSYTASIPPQWLSLVFTLINNFFGTYSCQQSLRFLPAYLRTLLLNAHPTSHTLALRPEEQETIAEAGTATLHPLYPHLKCKTEWGAACTTTAHRHTLVTAHHLNLLLHHLTCTPTLSSNT